MDEYKIRAGDRLPAFEVQLINHLGEPAENLGSATSIIMKYRPANGGAWITRPAQLVDASAARVKYEWAAGETDVAANYIAYFRATFADGRSESFPNYRYIRIAVGEE